MRKIYLTLTLAFLLPYAVFTQPENHAQNGSFEESTVQEYGRGSNPNNPGWQFLWNNGGFDGLQLPIPSVVENDEAYEGVKAGYLQVQELPAEAAANGQSFFAQIVGFTPDLAEFPDAALTEGYYRVSLAFRPVTSNINVHMSIGNFSFEERRRLHNVELIADQWNQLNLVYYNALDARARLSVHYNLEENLAALPFNFYFDDFRFVKSSLESATVITDGTELHAVLGWHAASGTYDAAAFTVTAGENTVAVESAEVLEDGKTLKLTLDVPITEDQEVSLAYDNSLAPIDYTAEDAPVTTIDSFNNEYVVNNSEAEPVSIDNIVSETPLSVYPNPVKETVNLKGIENYIYLKIFSITGQQLLSLENTGAENLSIQVDHLKPGIYFLSVEDNNGHRETLRFIK
jgi:hypothetical protein